MVCVKRLLTILCVCIEALSLAVSTTHETCGRRSDGSPDCPNLKAFLLAYQGVWSSAQAAFAKERIAVVKDHEVRRLEKAARKSFSNERKLWEEEAFRFITNQSLQTLLAPIPRINASEFTPERFRKEFKEPRRAVIIEGLHDIVTRGDPWDAEFWRSSCGDTAVDLKRYRRGLRSWGEQEYLNSGRITLEQHLADTKTAYLVDFDVLRGCKANTADRMYVPRYFSQDFFQALPGERSIGDPSLFIGGLGTQTGLHTDFGSSHFWMLLTEGRKEWVIFDGHMAPFLYKDWSFAFYDVDPWEMDNTTKRMPLAAFASGVTAVIEPGDTLFVPAGSIHAARNLHSPTVGLTMNFVDETNLAAAIHELSADHKTHPMDQAMATTFKTFLYDSSTRPTQGEAGMDLPLWKFKGSVTPPTGGIEL